MCKCIRAKNKRTLAKSAAGPFLQKEDWNYIGFESIKEKCQNQKQVHSWDDIGYYKRKKQHTEDKRCFITAITLILIFLNYVFSFCNVVLEYNKCSPIATIVLIYSLSLLNWISSFFFSQNNINFATIFKYWKWQIFDIYRIVNFLLYRL